MIYNHINARHAEVFALDPIRRITGVFQIDTDKGVLRQYVHPITLDSWGEARYVERKFTAIWPIFGNSKVGPILFHLYGEIIEK
jgi:hypothetical protein